VKQAGAEGGGTPGFLESDQGASWQWAAGVELGWLDFTPVVTSNLEGVFRQGGVGRAERGGQWQRPNGGLVE